MATMMTNITIALRLYLKTESRSFNCPASMPTTFVNAMMMMKRRIAHILPVPDFPVCSAMTSPFLERVYANFFASWDLKKVPVETVLSLFLMRLQPFLTAVGAFTRGTAFPLLVCGVERKLTT